MLKNDNQCSFIRDIKLLRTDRDVTVPTAGGYQGS